MNDTTTTEARERAQSKALSIYGQMDKTQRRAALYLEMMDTATTLKRLLHEYNAKAWSLESLISRRVEMIEAQAQNLRNALLEL